MVDDVPFSQTRHAIKATMILKEVEDIVDFKKDIENLKRNILINIHERTQEFLRNSKIKNKNYYDKNINIIDVKVKDLVLIRKEPYKKFEPIYSGPYKIKEIKGKNVIVEINNKPYEIHKNRIVKQNHYNQNKE